MNKEIKRDGFGRIISIIEHGDGYDQTRSVEYASSQGEEAVSYRSEIIFSNGARSYRIYNADGQIMEDAQYGEGGVPRNKHTYHRSPNKRKTEISIYVGKGESFSMVNSTYASEKGLDRINPDREFSDFLSKETPIENIQRETEARGLKTPAELYAQRDGSLNDRETKPLPEKNELELPKADFDAEGKARFDFGTRDGEGPGLGAY